MLTIFRRHIQSCRFKSRRDRNCKCPIAVEGKLNGEAVRRQLETRDWNTANAIIHRWERQQYIGPERESANRIAVKDSVERYLSDCEARHLAPLTLRKYRATLCGNPAARNLRKDITPTPHLLAWCAEKSIEHLDELNLDRLREYRASWNDGPNTAAKRLEYLRGWWKFCAAAGWVALETFEALKPPKARQAQKQPFTTEEMRRILDACDKRPRAKQLRALVLLMRYSGQRILAASRKKGGESGETGIEYRTSTEVDNWLYPLKSAQPTRGPMAKTKENEAVASPLHESPSTENLPPICTQIDVSLVEEIEERWEREAGGHYDA